MMTKSFFILVLTIAFMPGRTVAAIPADGQLGLASDVDVGVLGVIKARHNPTNAFVTGATSHAVVAPDPSNSDRSVMGMLNFKHGSDVRELWRKLIFEHRPSIGVNVRPDALTLETDVFLEGPQETFDFLRLQVSQDSSKAAITIRSIDANGGALAYPVNGGQMFSPVFRPLAANGWRRIRLAYTAASSPGNDGGNDGRVRLWMKDDPVAGDWHEVASATRLDTAQVQSFEFGLVPLDGRNSSSIYFRRLAWQSDDISPDEK